MVFGGILSVLGNHSIALLYMSSLPERYIIISSEDDRERVAGGIGTYLGILATTLRELYPEMEVVWISRSDIRDADFIDDHGVRRIYIKPVTQCLSSYLEMGNHDFAELFNFIQRLTVVAMDVFDEKPNVRTVIEVGEWEGHAYQLFLSLRNRNNILKLTRIHTPLAACMETNCLVSSTLTDFQIMTERETIRHADIVSPVTNFIRAVAEQKVCHIPESKILVSPNPVNASLFVPNKVERSFAIQKVNQLLGSDFLTQETFNIFVIGSVETRKGVNLVMSAIPDICNRVNNARILFVGHLRNESDSLTANSKFSRNEISRAVSDAYKGNVECLGFVEQSVLSQIIHAADIVPVMYLSDNFPGVVAEAALSAKPILYLERGGVPEMLTDEFGNKYGIPLGSDSNTAPTLLAQEIERYSKKPEYLASIGNDCYELIAKKYPPQLVVASYVQNISRWFDK